MDAAVALVLFAAPWLAAIPILLAILPPPRPGESSVGATILVTLALNVSVCSVWGALRISLRFWS